MLLAIPILYSYIIIYKKTNKFIYYLLYKILFSFFHPRSINDHNDELIILINYNK